MAVCGVRLFTLPALLFVVFDVFYRDSVLGFTPNELATSCRLIYKSFTAVAKPVSAFVAILTGNAHVFMHACLRAVPNVFTA